MKNKSEDRVFKILFPVREKRSAAVSLFPFRQISEFPTGAALLKAAELSRHCRLVYVTYRKVSEGRSFRMPYRKLGGTAVELSSLCTFVQRDFLCHRKLRPMTQKRSAGCNLIFPEHIDVQIAKETATK